MTTATLIRPLPSHFHRQDFLAFHRRDKDSVAERCMENVIEKGIF